MDNAIWLKIIETVPLIISAVGSVITAIGVIVVGRWAYVAKSQSASNAGTLAANTATLSSVEKKVDGMSSDLVAATKDAEFAKGKLDERDAERLHLSETPHPLPVVNGSGDDPLKVKLVKGKEI